MELKGMTLNKTKSETADFLSHTESRIHKRLWPCDSLTCVISSLFLPLTLVFYLSHHVSFKLNTGPFQMVCRATSCARLGDTGTEAQTCIGG